jgi:hypothetical protein
MKIDDIFAPFITPADEPSEETERDKAEVRAFLSRPENQHVLYSAEFTREAVRHAAALGIKPMTDEEADAYDAALENESTCPYCGHHNPER